MRDHRSTLSCAALPARSRRQLNATRRAATYPYYILRLSPTYHAHAAVKQISPHDNADAAYQCLASYHIIAWR